MVRMDTGWKPMLLYAVAKSRRVRGTACRRISIPRVSVRRASSVDYGWLAVSSSSSSVSWWHERNSAGYSFVLIVGRFLPGAETLSFVHNLSAGRGHKPSATIDCLEKHRSPVRTKYRLEAYATLRRCQVAAGTRKRLQEDFHTSRASPESKVA